MHSSCSCGLLIHNDYYAITGGEDYRPGPFPVFIDAGEINISFIISIIDDNVFERNESFILTINSSSLPSRVLVQPDSKAIVTIVDDDGGELLQYVY